MSRKESKIDRIKYTHYRMTKGHNAPQRYSRKNKWFSKALLSMRPETHGGKTICRIDLDNNCTLLGMSSCSVEDSFIYKKGRSIALLRALLKGIISNNLEMKIDNKRNALVLTFRKS